MSRSLLWTFAAPTLYPTISSLSTPSLAAVFHREPHSLCCYPAMYREDYALIFSRFASFLSLLRMLSTFFPFLPVLLICFRAEDESSPFLWHNRHWLFLSLVVLPSEFPPHLLEVPSAFSNLLQLFLSLQFLYLHHQPYFPIHWPAF